MREDIAMFAVKNNICLIYFPHNATHKMQPNDQVVHLLLKMSMADILKKARESWGNIHYYICQKDFFTAKPTVSGKHTKKGLLSAGDGSLRDPSMRAPQYRAAHFHTGDSRSKFSLTQRDHIIAAMWVWKASITEDAVKISWAACFLIPFNPRGHEIYSARAERAKAELEKTVPAGLTNLLPATDNLRCGLVFSGDEVRQQAAEVRLTSNANIAVLEGRVTSKQKNLGKAAENTKKHTAASEARVASDTAIAEVEGQRRPSPM